MVRGRMGARSNNDIPFVLMFNLYAFIILTSSLVLGIYNIWRAGLQKES